MSLLQDQLKDLLPESFWVVAENDSRDSTLQQLRLLANEKPWVSLLELGTQDGRFPLRTDRLAFARNRLKQYAFELNHELDFVVVLDSDNVISGIRAEHVLSLISHLRTNPDISGAFSNSAPAYYDVWALRHPIWSPDDCWQRVKYRPLYLSRKRATRRFVAARQLTIPSVVPPIDVQSAFNGLGVYRAAAALSSEYVGRTTSGDEICEHVPFNLQIAAFSRLQILPNVVLRAPSEHLLLRS